MRNSKKGKYWNKARPKPNKINIKSCNFRLSTQCRLWWDAVNKAVVRCNPCLAPKVFAGLSLWGCLYSLSLASSSRHFTLLASPDSWGLLCTFRSTHCFTHCFLRAKIPGVLNLTMKSGCKLPWHKPCILHACKIRIMWIIPTSAVSLSSSWPPMDHGCSDLLLPGWLSMVKLIHGNQFPATLLQ